MIDSRIFLLLLVMFAFVQSRDPIPLPPNPDQEEVVCLQVPVAEQDSMECLVVSVSMVLKYWHCDLSPQLIRDQIPMYRDGTTGADLLGLVQSVGLRGFLIQPPFEDLFDHLRKRRPLIVALPLKNSRHAVVLVGFDRKREIVWLNDPAVGKRVPQNLASFRSNWEKGNRWTFLIVPK